MKNQYYTLLTFIALLLVAASCKRTLESEPLELQSEDYVWDTQDSAGVLAGEVLNDVYSHIPVGHNRVLSYITGEIGSDFLDAATDDAVSSGIAITPVQLIATGAGINPFTNNEWGSGLAPTDLWAKNYQGIRKATIFINNIDKVPLAGTIPGNRPLRSAWKAEARFLRALFYFELVKRFGGIPLMGDEVRQVTDNVLLPRNSFADCVEYIVSECDAIKDSLRYDRITDAEFGRVTQGAAMALKARTLLYAASPLYNGGNTGTTAEQRLVAGYPSLDISRWKRAVTAAEDIVKLQKFNLHDDFREVFTIANNEEVIFARNNGAGTEIETANGPIGFSGTAQGNSRTSPTQELVDAFPMVSGLAITDPASGYNENDPYGLIDTSKKRDPRLDYTVLHMGSTWLNTSIQTFEGGRNKPGGTRIQTKTSYYLRKFMGPFETQTAYAATPHNFIIFRYAEVLLNFAEAQNEFAGPTAQVYEAIKQLRKRAGIKAGDGNYGLTAGMSKEQMRLVIQNERRVELAFEEHRYWDIRRWKIAENLNRKAVHGLRIIYSSVTNSYESTPVEIYTMSFDKNKMYIYPISQSEMDKNRNLVQNPGW